MLKRKRRHSSAVSITERGALRQSTCEKGQICLRLHATSTGREHTHLSVAKTPLLVAWQFHVLNMLANISPNSLDPSDPSAVGAEAFGINVGRTRPPAELLGQQLAPGHWPRRERRILSRAAARARCCEWRKLVDCRRISGRQTAPEKRAFYNEKPTKTIGSSPLAYRFRHRRCPVQCWAESQ